jgi:hypothetical protein
VIGGLKISDLAIDGWPFGDGAFDDLMSSSFTD